MVVVTGLIVKFSVAILAVYYGKEMTWFITTFDLLTCVTPLTLTGVLTELIVVKPLVTRITKIESMIRFAAMVVLTLLEESDNIGGFWFFKCDRVRVQGRHHFKLVFRGKKRLKFFQFFVSALTDLWSCEPLEVEVCPHIFSYCQSQCILPRNLPFAAMPWYSISLWRL